MLPAEKLEVVESEYGVAARCFRNFPSAFYSNTPPYRPQEKGH